MQVRRNWPLVRGVFVHLTLFLSTAIIACACSKSVAHGGVILATTADAATLGPDGNFSSAAAAGGTSVANTTLTTGRAGSNSTTPSGRSYVIPFLLPTLPSGQTFTSANFTVYEAATNGAAGTLGTYPNGTNANFNADLYGLAARSSSAVLAGDYYQGSFDATPGTTLLEDNIATPSTTTVADATPLTTNGSGSAALTALPECPIRFGRPRQLCLPAAQRRRRLGDRQQHRLQLLYIRSKHSERPERCPVDHLFHLRRSRAGHDHFGRIGRLLPAGASPLSTRRMTARPLRVTNLSWTGPGRAELHLSASS